MRIDSRIMQLYAVTDRRWLNGRTLSEAVEEAIAGGVTLVQLREKELDDALFLAEAVELKQVCHRHGVPLIINDNVEVALKSGADGVHLGQDDTGIRQAREALGEEAIIGATAHNVEEAVRAEEAGADYLGCGAAFGSATKTDAKPIRLSEYQEITRAVRIPVAAIGGINRENIHELAGSGIAGVAVVSGIFAAADIRRASEELLAAARKL